jgi:hypothetical protein
MAEIRKWLTHDDQKDLFEVSFSVVLNILFLALTSLLLWPLGKPMLEFSLAKGYGLLWIVTFLSHALVNLIQRFFRANIYDHSDAYVISNLVVSCFLQAGWAAFAAITVHTFITDAPIWMLVILYLVGVLSCLTAFFAVSSFYQGHVYKLVSLPLALVIFIIFSVWPAIGRMLYGRFFDLL